GYDLTPHLNTDGRANVIAVRVDHSDYADSRWYTGSGIYRNVRLVITNAIHVKRHGIFVTTPNVSKQHARVNIETAVVNQSPLDGNVVVVNSIFSPEGELIETVEDEQPVASGNDIEVAQSINVADPLLWSPDHPRLYGLHTVIRAESGPVVDEQFTFLGIRYFHFDPDKGFSLNGIPMKIKGLCIHHDAGALGAAVPVQVWERRLRIFKELGCNAIRMSHNPPASNLLDLCDRMGFLVTDEAFDEWNGCKRKWVEGWNRGTPAYHGYAKHFEEWSEADLRETVLRDRNHPSIILWSIGNEIDYVDDPFPPNEPALVPIAKRLVAIVKSLDTSRPVTAALASPESNLFADCLDVLGYNYHEDLYEQDHAKFPKRVIYGSENGKGLNAWKAVETNEFIAGLHLWTGIDFLGEAGAWPFRNSQAGLLDIAGFKKPVAFFWQSLWTDDPFVHLECEEGGGDGAKTALTCYTNCESVELLRNGEPLGEQRLADNPERVLRWEIPSRDGVYVARGKRKGKVVCSTEWRVPGSPERLEVSVDREILAADGMDVAHVEVRIVDVEGFRVEEAEHTITCEINGPVCLIGMENGDPRSHEVYKTNHRRAFRGRLLLYVQSGREAGEVEVSLTAEGLPATSIPLNVDHTVAGRVRLADVAEYSVGKNGGEVPAINTTIDSVRKQK
ncbi:MAG: glycoside hydrolase family 2 TIM barrel-domain containing protein, partial [Candidatus Hydrogenedentes bacterium]|nr:glycoside hydrolase family 2 TIM barrel-domain containing protein [Candidatus Hydrogenedentota bacterium]